MRLAPILVYLLPLAGLIAAHSQDSEPTAEPRFTFVSGGPGFNWIEEGPGKNLLGGTVVDLTPPLRQLLSGREDRGLLVGAVPQDSLLAQSGMRVGDLLLSLNDRPAARSGDLAIYIAEQAVGDAIQLVWQRGEEHFTHEVQLRARDLPASHDEVPEPVQQRVAVFHQAQAGDSPSWSEPQGDATEPAKSEPTFVYMPSLRMKLEEMQARLDRLEKALADCVGDRRR